MQTLRISITTLLMSVPTVALSFVVIEASKLYQFHELMTIGFSNSHLVLQEAKNSWFLSLFFSLTRPTVNGLATCIKSCNEKKPLKNLHLLHLHQLLQFTKFFLIKLNMLHFFDVPNLDKVKNIFPKMEKNKKIY